MYRELGRPTTIEKAWINVRSKAKKSLSQEIKNQLKNFERKSSKNIRSIAGKLRADSYVFSKQTPYVQKRGNKKKRPIVIADINDRVVQRAILDQLQSHSTMMAYLNTEYSFGGIKKKSVKEAINKVIEHYKNGKIYYIRSDIIEFFRSIPRDRVLAKIKTILGGETKFCNILKEATTVELAIISDLKDVELFPTYELGVAQGCCLSPAFGNILLHEFDRQMNDRGVVCIRYIDDFLLMSDNQDKLKKAYASATETLKQLGLKVHPLTNKEKVEVGNIDSGLNFLGCAINDVSVSPGHEAISRLKQKLKDLVNSSISGLSPKNDKLKHSSLLLTVNKINNVVLGWGSQYSFCTDFRFKKPLDEYVSVLLKRYIGRFNSELTKECKKQKTKIDKIHLQRRFCGIQLIADCKEDSDDDDQKMTLHWKTLEKKKTNSSRSNLN